MQIITLLSDMETFANIEDTFVVVFPDMADDATTEDIEEALKDPENGIWHPLYNVSQRLGWTDNGGKA